MDDRYMVALIALLELIALAEMVQLTNSLDTLLSRSSARVQLSFSSNSLVALHNILPIREYSVSFIS
jgi:hypothetical protein